MEKTDALGRCIICGVIGKGQKDFICENCGGPDKIIMTCTVCGDHMDLSELKQSDLANMESFIGRQLKPGMAVASQGCPNCCKGGGAGIAVAVYQIRV